LAHFFCGSLPYQNVAAGVGVGVGVVTGGVSLPGVVLAGVVVVVGVVVGACG